MDPRDCFRRLSNELLVCQGKKNGAFGPVDRQGWLVWPTVGKADDVNMFEWIAEIDGPVASPYEGGKFHFRFEFEQNGYPNHAPRVSFLTRMFHPNFHPDYGFDPVCVLPPSSRVPVHL